MASADAVAVAETFKLIHPEKFLEAYVAEDVRPDGRGLLDFRNTSINVGSIGTADGSSLVRIGQTTVMCGIKAELANPPIESPSNGWIVPNVTIPPLGCARVRTGPPTHQAQVLSQYIADLLRTANVIDLKDLCISNGKLAWVLYIDAYVLNYDGNITDACVLSVLAALRDLKLPKLNEIETGDDSIPTVQQLHAIAVKVQTHPISISFGGFRGHIMADPTDEEETLLQSSITIVQDEHGNLQGLSQPSPSGVSANSVGTSQGLTTDQVRQCCGQATVRAKHIMKLLSTVCGDQE